MSGRCKIREVTLERPEQAHYCNPGGLIPVSHSNLVTDSIQIRNQQKCFAMEAAFRQQPGQKNLYRLSLNRTNHETNLQPVRTSAYVMREHGLRPHACSRVTTSSGRSSGMPT